MSYEFLEDVAIADIAFRAGERSGELFQVAMPQFGLDNLRRHTFSLENDALDLCCSIFLRTDLLQGQRATFVAGTVQISRKMDYSS